MKEVRGRGGVSRPFYSDADFERIAEEELRAQGLLPTTPGPIRIERFVEKRFGITPEYEELPRGVLGYTEFDSSGVRAVFVSRTLSEVGGKVQERRINTTLAHEAGHGLLHAHLFALDSFPRSLFEDSEDVDPQRILCREEREASSALRGYDGAWWEVQANRMIGGLLLPRSLVREALDDLFASRGGIGARSLPNDQRLVAETRLSTLFDVNPRVAQLRIRRLYPPADEAQLTL